MFSYLRSIISGFLVFFFLCSPLNIISRQRCDAQFNGTFIQSWMCGSWSEERWDKEVACMKEAGIEYLIIQTTADKDKNGAWSVSYPSKLKALENARVVGDVISSALRCCESNGIKVFVGLTMFDDWWSEVSTTEQYTEVCTIAADMAKEIYSLYKSDYPDTLYGWYFVPEINNATSMSNCIESTGEGINILISAINSLDKSMPLLLSPFYTDYYTDNTIEDTLKMWLSFFRTVNFRDGDIFAPQDSIGAGGTKEESLDEVFKMYFSAVKTAKADVKFWANCENFTSPRAKREGSGETSPTATLNTVSVPTTLDRLVWQMNIVSHYVENIITFSYNHYGSPELVNPVYHETYLDYLKNGHKLETEKPTAPVNVIASTENGKTLVTWEASNDNLGIAYYLISVDGVPTCRAEFSKGNVATSIIIDEVAGKIGVIAVDGAGNISDVAVA